MSVLRSVHTDSGVHPGFYSVGKGGLRFQSRRRPEREIGPSLHLAPMLRMSGYIPPLPHMISWLAPTQPHSHFLTLLHKTGFDHVQVFFFFTHMLDMFITRFHITFHVSLLCTKVGQCRL